MLAKRTTLVYTTRISWKPLLLELITAQGDTVCTNRGVTSLRKLSANLIYEKCLQFGYSIISCYARSAVGHFSVPVHIIL